MFEVLEGKNIRLRKARKEDYQSMLKHVWGDEAVYRWMLYQPTLTEEDAIERCRRSMEFQKDHYAYFVALKDTDEAVGLCAIKETAPGHYEESGICIGTAFLRYGYFRENEKSKKVAEFFGFRYDYTYELTRPWDGCVKTIESCIMTREEYNQRKLKT